MQRPPLPQGIIKQTWAGQSRRCPECGTDFVSRENRGRCPNCKHVFFAYDVYGAPPGVDLEQLAQESAIVSAESSDWIMTLLTERAEELPKRYEHFDDPRVKALIEHEIEWWDWDNYLMEQALADGGELWHWSTSPESWEAMAGRCGLAVVKDGRVTAVTCTAMN